jgi:hypothetical protein
MNDLVGRTNKSMLFGLACTATVVLSVLCAGCGESNPLSGVPRYPVKGKVLLATGKPLEAGRMVFVGTKTASFTTDIGHDGTFAFTGASGDGLPEDEYAVRIEAVTSSKIKGSNALPFPGNYSDEDTSGLKATVTSEESKNNFEFKLEGTDPAGATARSKRRDDR